VKYGLKQLIAKIDLDHILGVKGKRKPIFWPAIEAVFVFTESGTRITLV